MLDSVSLWNSNSVKTIERKSWPALRDVYRTNWPRHILSYHTLKTYIEWVEQNQNLDIAIYTSDSDWQTHGTYVIVEHSGSRCNVLFNTLDPNKYQNLLFEAFQCLNLLAYEPFTLAAFVESVQPVANQVIENLQVTINKRSEAVLFYLPMKESLQLPEGDKLNYQFKNLSLDDVPLINRLWTHRYPGSELYIKNLIRYNLTLGAYEARSGKLIGWIMQEQVGTIGLLQVEDSFKRQGIAEQLLICMAILLANAGMDSTAVVSSTNRSSRHLFHRLGFKVINKVFWNDIIPSDESEENNTMLKLESKVIHT